MELNITNIFNKLEDLKTKASTSNLLELLNITLKSIDEKLFPILFYKKILTTTTIKFRDQLKILRKEITEFIESLNENSDENCRELIKEATKNLSELFNTKTIEEEENQDDDLFNNLTNYNSEEIEPVLLNTIIKDKKQKKIIDKNILIKDYNERIININDILLKNKSNKKIKIPIELLNLIEEYKQREVIRRNSISVPIDSFNEENFQEFSNNQFNETELNIPFYEENYKKLEEENYKKLELKNEFIFQEEIKDFNNLEKSHAFLMILNEGNKNLLEIEQPLIWDSIYCKKI